MLYCRSNGNNITKSFCRIYFDCRHFSNESKFKCTISHILNIHTITDIGSERVSVSMSIHISIWTFHKLVLFNLCLFSPFSKYIIVELIKCVQNPFSVWDFTCKTNECKPFEWSSRIVDKKGSNKRTENGRTTIITMWNIKWTFWI